MTVPAGPDPFVCFPLRSRHDAVVDQALLNGYFWAARASAQVLSCQAPGVDDSAPGLFQNQSSQPVTRAACVAGGMAAIADGVPSSSTPSPLRSRGVHDEQGRNAAGPHQTCVYERTFE